MIVELTQSHQQAIEAVARTLWEHVEGGDPHLRTDTQEAYAQLESEIECLLKVTRMHQISNAREHLRVVRANLEIVPQRWRDLAAMFVSAIEAMNGTTLAGIVKAARMAGCTETDECEKGRHCSCPFDSAAFFSALAVEGIGRSVGCASGCGCATDATYGAYHEGPCVPLVPSWFTDHAKFSLGPPLSHYADCPAAWEHDKRQCRCGAANGREFVIPAIRIAGQEVAG